MAIFTGENPQTPSPSIVKIEIFHPVHSIPYTVEIYKTQKYSL